MTGEARLSAAEVGVSLGGRAVVAEVSFSLAAGRLVALVGPNGAGKTTLLRALAGLVPATGAIAVAGRALAGLSRGELARTFGYLPQGHIVHWPLPVRDVVALGRFPHGAVDPGRLPPHDAAAVELALRAADIEHLASRRATELSGGERARVALARVLAVEAPIILADEPTASLDPRYQLAVMAGLGRAAAAGPLVIAVTHDLGLAMRFADTVLVLQDGRLAAAGPPDTALSDEVLADVFRIRAFRASHEARPVLVPWAEG